MKLSNIKFFGLAVIALLASIGVSNAASVADSTCDPAYMQSLEARAWLEAQREITQNQNLIAKPDSVLAYNCFDQFAGLLSEQEASMFSGDESLGTKPNKRLSEIIHPLIGAPLTTYAFNNFHNPNNHKYRGGRGDAARDIGSTTSASYTCEVMKNVWKSAKCADFIEKTAHDGFFTLKQYSEGEDKRELPESCGPALAEWNTQIERSGLDDTTTGTPWREDLPKWGNDQDKSYTVFSDPTSCGDTPAIETGVLVQLTGEDAQPFKEKFCIQPGCYYNGDTCASKL